MRGADTARGRAGAQTPRGVGWGADAMWGQVVRGVQARQTRQSRASGRR
jgi:hypothetical protein